MEKGTFSFSDLQKGDGHHRGKSRPEAGFMGSTTHEDEVVSKYLSLSLDCLVARSGRSRNSLIVALHTTRSVIYPQYQLIGTKWPSFISYYLNLNLSPKDCRREGEEKTSFLFLLTASIFLSLACLKAFIDCWAVRCTGGYVVGWWRTLKNEWKIDR